MNSLITTKILAERVPEPILPLQLFGPSFYVLLIDIGGTRPGDPSPSRDVAPSADPGRQHRRLDRTDLLRVHLGLPLVRRP